MIRPVELISQLSVQHNLFNLKSIPGDNGQMWWAHAGPHKQHHILVPSVAVGHHLALESLELVLVVALDVDQADGHLTVPTSVENLAEASLTDHLSDL